MDRDVIDGGANKTRDEYPRHRKQTQYRAFRAGWRVRDLVLGMTLLAVVVSSRAAWAHHEAVLGPQSAAVMDGSGYAALQIFTKRTASPEEPQETSMLLSGGVTPFSDLPVSFNLTLPVSIACCREERMGLENILVSSRFRLNLTDLQRAFGKDGNYVMFFVGVELPTGSMDQPLGKAPTNALLGLMSSLERGPWAALGFVLTRQEGTNAEGLRKGHELFAGAGLAYTPIETEKHMMSFQIGASYEVGLTNRLSGEPSQGGFQRLMFTPATVMGVHPKVQLLGYGGLPLRQSAMQAEDRMHWRLGVGVSYFFD